MRNTNARLRRLLAAVAIGGAFIWGVGSVHAQPPALGSAKGDLIVDGKTLALKHAVAVGLPDTFEETKEAFSILITPEPLAADSITAVKRPDDVRSAAKVGIVLKHGVNGYHLTIRHPVLGEKELQQSQGGAPPLDARGPDRVAGTIKSFGKGPEEIAGHKVQFQVAFNAPVQRRFPVEQKLALAAGAKKLPPGGGEIGTAYLGEKCKALPKNLKDRKAFEEWLKQEGRLPSDADLAEMSKRKGKKVTRDDAIAEAHGMLEMITAMTPADCKVVGGQSDGKLAVLQVEATVMGSRSRADVYMVNEGGKWSLKKQDAWKDVK
jgi:hypothetical protein